jgi:hypothetical protein
MSSNSKVGGILFDLYVCLQGRRPIPPRVSASFIELYEKALEVGSWEEVFGRPISPHERDKLERRMNESRRVAEAVEDLQAKGESLNEAAFEAIGRDTAVGGKPRSRSF